MEYQKKLILLPTLFIVCTFIGIIIIAIVGCYCHQKARLQQTQPSAHTKEITASKVLEQPC